MTFLSESGTKWVRVTDGTEDARSVRIGGFLNNHLNALGIIFLHVTILVKPLNPSNHVLRSSPLSHRVGNDAVSKSCLYWKPHHVQDHVTAGQIILDVDARGLPCKRSTLSLSAMLPAVNLEVLTLQYIVLVWWGKVNPLMIMRSEVT